MSFDKSLWCEEFDDKFPEWICPSCQRGILCYADQDLDHKPDASYLNSTSHPDWEPSWETGSFAATLRCNRPQCREIVRIIGKYAVKDVVYRGGAYHNQYCYIPKAIYPAPYLVALNSQLPDDLAYSIIEASETFWISISSCVNKIRIIVEKMLTDKGIPKLNGKGYRINLHNRIIAFSKTDQINGDALMTLKIFGNDATHGDNIDREDVLLSIGILADVLREVYPQPRNVNSEKIKSILQAHEGRI